MTTIEARATRIAPAKIRVVLPDGGVKEVGGARATRASVAIVYQRKNGDWNVLGLRADADAGRREAERMSTATSQRSPHSSTPIPIEPTPALCLDIEDAL